MAFKRVPLWYTEVTLGQQYNIGEKPTVILYTYINRHAGTQEKQRKQKRCSTSSNMVVIIYCYMYEIDCVDKATTWYYIQYTVNRSCKYMPGMIWVKD